jgi:drug/metabolite transporter (DMT)-like permease
MTRRPAPTAYVLLTVAVAAFGAHTVVGRVAAPDIPPLALTFWRWLLAFVVLLPIAWPHLRANWPLIVAHRGKIAAASLFFVIGFNVLFYLGLHDTTAINAALLNSVAPVVIVLVMWIGRMERLTLRQGVGLAVCIAGVVVVVLRGDLGVLLTLSVNRGDLIFLLAMLSFALYSTVLRRLPGGVHPVIVMCAMIVVGLPVLAPLYAWEYAATGPFALSGGNLMIIAYVVLGQAVIAFFCWMQGVRTVGANRAAIMFNLVPVFTALFAFLFLGESLQPYHGAGFVLIFVGMCLALLGRDRAAKVEAPAP